jgi:DNA-binding winged helix-turn-helix (wHTH) protein
MLFLFGCAICVAFSMTGDNDFNIARREILLRNIGHQLLLQSGDGTSRVLPVEKIAENEYQLRFEKEFTFTPDYLVNTTRRLLAQDPLTTDYVVNVMNGSQANAAYGYAISENKKSDIVPCRGRVQPIAPYRIYIKFKPTHTSILKNGYLLGSLPLLAFVGFIFFRPNKPKMAPGKDRHNGIFTFGAVTFDPQERRLIIDKEMIDLTGTETRLLFIFASSPNQVIERSRLQKEIWEDEGVIVGRSLDMFISKLRKKLELDPYSRIVVIRGKGYRLAVSA